ncbi:hypothetical protein DMB45_03635 [Sanguibacteroides justesenii]|uniref:Preprotein translocase subunit SecG n=1 Tax=Sanguibacteroides justesenii TaxID=1547597 RepID=A0AB34R2G9_9PORP|nr:hypothetical protein IE90_07475 [Sanguibacteroides justesenii]PXZ44546.1 hypothetical protein DMB45_03635 [Sanguibacteroides justesenii]
MRISRYLLILAAFLIMISSVLSLFHGGDRTAVYVNIAAMASIAIAVSITSFKNPNKRNL